MLPTITKTLPNGITIRIIGGYNSIKVIAQKNDTVLEETVAPAREYVALWRRFTEFYKQF